MPDLLKALREESGAHNRVIAGDFNSQLAFPYPFAYPYPPDFNLRRSLADLLVEASFTCHTAHEEYPAPLPPRYLDQTLIDHVCTNFGRVESLETWSGTDEQSPILSDHPGVVVDLFE